MYTLPSSIIPFHIIIFLSLCQPRSILSLLVRLHALQAPKNDDAFWNAERCRGMEPSSTVFEQQHDVVNTQYVGNWHYNYRSRGMKTSTDDVIVAYMACASTSSSKDNISRYVDFGCGIGSTLLLVDYNLCPLTCQHLGCGQGHNMKISSDSRCLHLHKIHDNESIVVYSSL